MPGLDITCLNLSLTSKGFWAELSYNHAVQVSQRYHSKQHGKTHLYSPFSTIRLGLKFSLENVCVCVGVGVGVGVGVSVGVCVCVCVRVSVSVPVPVSAFASVYVSVSVCLCVCVCVCVCVQVQV